MRRSLWIVLCCWCLSVATSAQTVSPIALLDNLPDCGFEAAADREDLRVGAVIFNLESGLGCTENLDETFNAASVPKIFVAGAYYEWLSAGLVSANTQLPFTESYWMGGRTDCLGLDEIDAVYTNQELVELMINCSDNAATWMLMDSLGWFRVQQYVDSLGIESIGPVIPYSEVDRLKMAFIDPTWGEIPRGVVSRFYRGRNTGGLLDYFSEIPSYPNRSVIRDANNRYFSEYDYNTITPRALAEYFLMLRDDLLNNGPNAVLALRLFNVMLFTQRQYSMQALPGTVLIGSKNGFDRGLLAEANIVFNDPQTRIPSAIALIFTQYEPLTGANDELSNSLNDSLNRYLFNLSPQISDILYPAYTDPPVGFSPTLSTVRFLPQIVMQNCWSPYVRNDFDETLVNDLENCYNNSFQPETFLVGENLAFGMILRNLGNVDSRLVLVFTAPDGRIFSYQTDRRFMDRAGVFWFHPLDMAGTWTVDVYLNAQHINQSRIDAV